MNIFMKLQSIDNLSGNERIVADYILKHPDTVLNMNNKALAKACFVSVSTIYRLCDKLELSGYSELKLQISTNIDKYLKGQDFNYDFPVKKYQTYYEILTHIKEDYQKTVESTFGLFDLEELRLVTSAMKKANVIDIYTTSGNVYFAKNFRFQMMEIGKQVNVPVDEYEQRLLAATSDESHLAILISFGGRSQLSKELPRILKETNTPLLLICSPEFNKIPAQYKLYINPYENHYNKISSFSTRLSILYILDILYTCYFERDYDELLEKKIGYYKNMVGGPIK